MHLPAELLVACLTVAPTTVQVGTGASTQQLALVGTLPDASTPGDVLAIALYWNNTVDGGPIEVTDNFGDLYFASATADGTDHVYGARIGFFTTTIRDAGLLTFTCARTAVDSMGAIGVELAGSTSTVVAQAGATGLSPNVDAGTLRAPANAAMIGYALVFGTAGDAGPGFTAISRFQGDLVVLGITGDAGAYTFTAQSEAMPFGAQGAWVANFIALAPLVPDSGALDSGASDAGPSDAGVLDAGSPDSGNPPDAGDAGPVGPPEPQALSLGCGCSSDPSGLLAWLALSLCVAYGARKRFASTR